MLHGTIEVRHAPPASRYCQHLVKPSCRHPRAAVGPVLCRLELVMVRGLRPNAVSPMSCPSSSRSPDVASTVFPAWFSRIYVWKNILGIRPYAFFAVAVCCACKRGRISVPHMKRALCCDSQRGRYSFIVLCLHKTATLDFGKNTVLRSPQLGRLGLSSGAGLRKQKGTELRLVLGKRME